MIRENHVCLNDLIYPIFVVPGTNVKEEIPSMPGCYHLSVDNAVRLAEDIYALGLRAIEVFGLPAYKDEIGSSAWDPQSPVQCAIRAIKKTLPDMVIVGDVCLCQYTDHGHCGQVKDHYVDNDATLKLLNKVAVSQAEAGADIVAPSDMMDGRIASIRQALDEPIQTVLKTIVSILEKTPPELAADIADHGIVLTGGGLLLDSFDRLISQTTGMAAYLCDEPLLCVANGAGKALREMDRLKDSFDDL